MYIISDNIKKVVKIGGQLFKKKMSARCDWSKYYKEVQRSTIVHHRQQHRKLIVDKQTR